MEGNKNKKVDTPAQGAGIFAPEEKGSITQNKVINETSKEPIKDGGLEKGNDLDIDESSDKAEKLITELIESNEAVIASNKQVIESNEAVIVALSSFNNGNTEKKQESKKALSINPDAKYVVSNGSKIKRGDKFYLPGDHVEFDEFEEEKLTELLNWGLITESE